MTINNNCLNSIKKGIALVSSICMISTISSCKNNKEEKKIKNTNNFTLESELEEIVTYKENEYITKDEFNYFNNTDNYYGKDIDEIAIMFSENRDFDELNYILSIAPSSLNENEIISYDSMAEARVLCRDLMNKKFYDSALKSIESANSIDNSNLNITEDMKNNSDELYNNLLLYIDAYNNKDADLTIKYGLNIKNNLYKNSIINIFNEKINSLDDTNEYSYRGNNDGLSNINILGDSIIKDYYDISNEYFRNNQTPILTLTICRDDFLYYLENYFNLLKEEYVIIEDNDSVYAVEVSKAIKEKTLALN